jgi:hypothetical protein
MSAYVKSRSAKARARAKAAAAAAMFKATVDAEVDKKREAESEKEHVLESALNKIEAETLQNKKQEDGKQYACAHCKVDHTADHFNREQLRRVKQGNVGRCRLYFKEKNFEAKYGLTPTQLKTMQNRQGYMCRICCRAFNSDDVKMHIDHNHDTKAVRGLLCLNCNVLLGHAKDSVATLLHAAMYLVETTPGVVTSKDLTLKALSRLTDIIRLS